MALGKEGREREKCLNMAGKYVHVCLDLRFHKLLGGWS